ncbi:uncharacterized protein LOC142349445 isoform X2 [Convolutriloba macropyga]|uniref:uncharacterized protein LOC142349445 isoform X2 n=1 Tax=Convolutriloba macropyga TaxID=536237 RepID=UPI003F51EF2A
MTSAVNKTRDTSENSVVCTTGGAALDHDTVANKTTTEVTQTRSLSVGGPREQAVGNSPTARRLIQPATATSSIGSRTAHHHHQKMKRKPSKKLKKGPMEGINENAEELGETLLEEFAVVTGTTGSASGSQPEDVKYRWASKFSPDHMYCSMKGYEDILDERYSTDTTKDRGRRFSSDRDNMVIASMKHQQDAAFVAQVNEKQMDKISTKFTAAMRLLDAHKHSQGLPHTSKQPIMQSDPKDVYQAWSVSWKDDFNFRPKTFRETTSVIDEIRERQWGQQNT